MSTDASEDAADDAGEETLAEEIETWLVKQMPIIKMHGGTSNVRKADPETGEVVVELGGGCAGCDVADITAGNIEADLIKKYPEVEEVTVRVPESGGSFGVDQEESIMGVDRTEGGRGDFKDGRW
ncbi:NifU family protein [Natronoarchaeum mannanilyticum]|uniref:NifU family protein n=1 Tax=Natronoarchaeum mannanilyticum TaxID=926360 RepID=A0AAV3T6A7_9EURY|nr:NifU family protein [Natronoarchaeum rubrum]HMB49590.1 NifU family protein [Natronoarchaeum rubrum]